MVTLLLQPLLYFAFNFSYYRTMTLGFMMIVSAPMNMNFSELLSLSNPLPTCKTFPRKSHRNSICMKHDRGWHLVVHSRIVLDVSKPRAEGSDKSCLRCRVASLPFNDYSAHAVGIIFESFILEKEE
ncbi:hypothetical protein HZH68_015036 [Vespula germanica]|uniref:Uncharacterized protein n=1 Tax=Vespula germanica TaxID=30212 RepID=A0A834J9R2_VESGE|nr:hypothetical protein HZH68_015036 [Vespula germanica]